MGTATATLGLALSLVCDPCPTSLSGNWRLDASEGDQAPLHVHHGGEEAFICLDGNSKSKSMGYATRLIRGRSSWFPRGAVHTFATRGGAHVLAVMNPEIDRQAP
jgi:quercetin dioxygenase-like cupin family protein